MKNNISELYFNKKTIDVLNKIDKTPNHLYPSIILVGDDKGCDEFAIEYEKKLRDNGAFNFVGKRTLLELVFPKGAEEEDYIRFFDSPRNYSMANQYRGIFYISFEEWKNANELINDSAFDGLLDYIDANKNTSFYIFRFRKEFENAKEVKRIMSLHLNTETIILNNLDIDASFIYIKGYLKEMGIKFRPDASEELKRILTNLLNSYSSIDYSLIDQIANNIQYELCLNNKDDNGKEKRRITENMVKKIENKFLPVVPKTHTRKIGF